MTQNIKRQYVCGTRVQIQTSSTAMHFHSPCSSQVNQAYSTLTLTPILTLNLIWVLNQTVMFVLQLDSSNEVSMYGEFVSLYNAQHCYALSQLCKSQANPASLTLTLTLTLALTLIWVLTLTVILYCNLTRAIKSMYGEIVSLYNAQALLCTFTAL